MDMKDPADTNS
jgi:ubiquitin-protein ligase